MGLMALSCFALVIASSLHSGATIAGIHDSFSDAAVPEAVIAAVLAVGLATVLLRWRNGWEIALGATVFAIAGFLVGLRFTVFGDRGVMPGDVAYHLGGLAILLATAALLLSSAGRQALRRYRDSGA